MKLLPFPTEFPTPVFVEPKPDGGLRIQNLTRHSAELSPRPEGVMVRLRAGDEVEQYLVTSLPLAMRFAANWLMLRAMYAFSKN